MSECKPGASPSPGLCPQDGPGLGDTPSQQACERGKREGRAGSALRCKPPGLEPCLSQRRDRTPWDARLCSESGAGGLLPTVCRSDANTFLLHVGQCRFGAGCRVFSAWDAPREELLIALLPPCHLERTAFCLRRPI